MTEGPILNVKGPGIGTAPRAFASRVRGLYRIFGARGISYEL